MNITTDGTTTTTAFEPTEAIEALPRLADDARGGAAARPAPGRYLAVEDGGARQLLALARPITHIGRGFVADLQLEDAGVSRRHAIVTQRRGRARILDDRSANGTFVNGRRVVEAELHDGDVIVLGNVVLQYVDVPA
jgi:pSer/pThr/pTyr-binding forkhead associated (FHA) protein